MLVVWSDGVTEAAHGEEESGDTALIRELWVQSGRLSREVADRVLARVQDFSDGNQSDGMTLLSALPCLIAGLAGFGCTSGTSGMRRPLIG
jgi:serine phosphatase RsbU (regulator of sigma subunit)